MNDVIYQASDLSSAKRTDFIRDAKAGGARLRDKDGSSLIFLPEKNVQELKSLAYWSQQHLLLSDLLKSGDALTSSRLGELAWLRVFDAEDIREFLDELHEILIAAISDGDSSVIGACVRAWRVTASEMSDPLRRAVLVESFEMDSFAEVANLTEGE